MKTFSLSIDRKGEVWIREKHEVKADNLADAVVKLANAVENPEIETTDLDSYTGENEVLYETQHDFTPKENDGQATIHICRTYMDGTPLWDNEPEKQEEQNENT